MKSISKIERVYFTLIPLDDKMRIGIDVGGTKIRVGVIGNNGEVLRSKCAPCPNQLEKQEVVDFIAEMVQEFFTDQVETIGVGVPAIVDEDGVIHDCVNIPSWDVIDLKSDFERRFRVPVSVRNDCNCYALGVKAIAPGSDYDDIVCITLGTGVGSGIIINGKLYLGVDSCAGEIGEIKYMDRNYEFYCSSQFFRFRGTSGKDAFIAASQNDPEALKLWDEFGSNVGDLLTLVTLAYSPQAIFLGGSISEAFPLFQASMFEKLAEFPYKKVADKLKVFANSSPDIILVGAVTE